MPGYVVQVGATVQCPHGASASISPTNQRVKVGGSPAAVLPDTTSVAGCPFQIPVGAGTKPSPCMTVQWKVGSQRVKVGGQSLLLQDSVGLCNSAEQAPQGPPTVATTQMRVKAT
jgi:hypothetical protein